jgi:hypothetical protein
MRASTAEVLADAETVVVGNSASEFREIGDRLDGQPVIDLARAFGGRVVGGGRRTRGSAGEWSAVESAPDDARP